MTQLELLPHDHTNALLGQAPGRGCAHDTRADHHDVGLPFAHVVTSEHSIV
jgi:hypothetical protein